MLEVVEVVFGFDAFNVGRREKRNSALVWCRQTLTVSGSFSNTSLASSLLHFSSTHSLSKCPCFVSSKTWFALLGLLRNCFASSGDSETSTKRKEKTPRGIHELTRHNSRRSNKCIYALFWSRKCEYKNKHDFIKVAKRAALMPR